MRAKYNLSAFEGPNKYRKSWVLPLLSALRASPEWCVVFEGQKVCRRVCVQSRLRRRNGGEIKGL
jgi:hypothetical protein